MFVLKKILNCFYHVAVAVWFPFISVQLGTLGTWHEELPSYRINIYFLINSISIECNLNYSLFLVLIDSTDHWMFYLFSFCIYSSTCFISLLVFRAPFNYSHFIMFSKHYSPQSALPYVLINNPYFTIDYSLFVSLFLSESDYLRHYMGYH